MTISIIDIILKLRYIDIRHIDVQALNLHSGHHLPLQNKISPTAGNNVTSSRRGKGKHNPEKQTTREKFSTLTEQMFYVLLALTEECCGMDIMAKVSQITDGRVAVGSGTLYNLLEQFSDEGIISETKTEGRRRSYILTQKGSDLLQREYDRIVLQAQDYNRIIEGDTAYDTARDTEKDTKKSVQPLGLSPAY